MVQRFLLVLLGFVLGGVLALTLELGQIPPETREVATSITDFAPYFPAMLVWGIGGGVVGLGIGFLPTFGPKVDKNNRVIKD